MRPSLALLSVVAAASLALAGDPPPPPASASSANFLVDVTGPDDAPVAGADVWVLPWSARDPFEWRLGSGWWPSHGETPLAGAPTDAKGRAVLSGLETGPVHVVVAAKGLATVDVESGSVRGAAPRPVAVRMRKASSLSGVVRDRDGKPLDGFTVVASPPSTTRGPAPPGLVHRAETAADGSYVLDRLAPGRWQVSAWSEASGFATDDAVQVPDAPRFDPIVHFGMTLRGRVLDAQTKAPVAGAELTFLDHRRVSAARLVCRARSSSSRGRSSSPTGSRRRGPTW